MFPFTPHCFNIQYLRFSPPHPPQPVPDLHRPPKHWWKALEQNVEMVWLDQCYLSFTSFFKKNKTTFSIPMTSDQQKYNTVLMAFETAMVNKAVKLSTWGWFSLQCAKEMNVLLFLRKYPGEPRTVLLEDGNDFREFQISWRYVISLSNKQDLFWGEGFAFTTIENYTYRLFSMSNNPYIKYSILLLAFLFIFMYSIFALAWSQSSLTVEWTVNEHSMFKFM